MCQSEARDGWRVQAYSKCVEHGDQALPRSRAPIACLRRHVGRVEDGRGDLGGEELPFAGQGQCLSSHPKLRFPSPLIEPDVRISRIRLSDWFHVKAHADRPTCSDRSRRTPISPKTLSAGNRRVPRVGTLWRWRRKWRIA